MLFRSGRLLYALNFARTAIPKAGAVVLCEGQLDAIAMHRAGVTHAVAPQGTAFTPEQATILKRYTSTAVLATDNDNAGREAVFKDAAILLPLGFNVKVVRYPGAKDADETLSKYGADALAGAVRDAADFFEFALEHALSNVDPSTPAGRAAAANDVTFALQAEFTARITEMNGGPIIFIIEILIMMVIIGLCIMLVQGTRRVPVQYAKRVVGNKQYGGVRNYLPLKVNAAGVMPIIFAQALMFIPLTFVNISQETTTGFWASFIDYNRLGYNIVFFLLIIAFTYFYTAITINPQQIAEDLKKNNGFIPGVKPGKQTAEYIDKIMSRITLPGSIFLGFVAVMPAIVRQFGVNQQFAQFFGGTSLLIMVGVVLDTLQQIESHLLMRHYDGLTKSGRIKGRMGGGIYGAH